MSDPTGGDAVGTGSPAADLAGLSATVLEEEARRRAAADAAEADEVVLPDELLPGVGSEALSVREGLRLGGLRIFVVLVLLNSLDELEGAALAVLAPDIRDSFGVSNGTIVFFSAAAGAFIVLGAVPMGWLADRFRRGPIIGAASLAFAGMAFLSGLAVNAFVFFCARFGAGRRQVEQPARCNGSMIADAYPIGVRGRLTAAERGHHPVGGGRQPGAGGRHRRGRRRRRRLAVGLPPAQPARSLFVAFFAFRLPEPARGQWEKADVLGEVIEDEHPPPIAIEAAFARLRSIATLRTIILGFAAIGFGLVTAPVLTSLFLEQRFGLDAAERGLVTTAGGFVALVAIPFVGQRYDRTFRENPAAGAAPDRAAAHPGRRLVSPVQLFMPNPWLFALWSIPRAVLLLSAFTMIVPICADRGALPAPGPGRCRWRRSTSSSSAPPAAPCWRCPWSTRGACAPPSSCWSCPPPPSAASS